MNDYMPVTGSHFNRESNSEQKGQITLPKKTFVTERFRVVIDGVVILEAERRENEEKHMCADIDGSVSDIGGNGREQSDNVNDFLGRYGFVGCYRKT